VTGTTIAGNTTSVNGGNSGGGICVNSGSVTLIDSTVSGNSATNDGGAICSYTALTLIDTTVANNSSGISIGGIVTIAGTITLTGSTITGSTDAGLYAYNTVLTMSNSVISGNAVDLLQQGSTTMIDNHGNLIGGVALAPLGNYGGPMQTAIPLPGSAAICGGTLANLTASGQTTDQRGNPNTNAAYPGYTAGSPCVDSGAVQTNYAMTFTTEPPASAIVGVALSPAPAVKVTESGIAAAGGSVSMSDADSALGGTLSASVSAGLATFSNLLFNSAANNDTLTTTLALNSSLTPPLSLTATAAPSVTAKAVAGLTSPAPGSTLAGFSTTFQWSAGTGDAAYQLWLGSTGVNSQNLYSSGATTATSATVTLPANGETIFARLYYEMNGTWYHFDYTYTASTLVPATLTSPTPGGALTGTSSTFTWSTATGATGYQLWLGSTGVNSNDLHSSGVTTATSLTANQLPNNGKTIFARLYTGVNGVWTHIDYTYTAWSQPAMTAPAAGTQLAAASVQFTWSGGTGVTGYQLWLGNTGVNSNNLYSSGVTTAASATAKSLPVDGEPIYARLYYELNGTWYHLDYFYTAANLVPAALTSPLSGDSLAPGSNTFTWSPGSGASGYQLWLGSTGVNSNDLFSSGVISATSVTVNSLPANGATIYGRLYTGINGVWSHADYVFTASTPKTIDSPAAGSTLPGPSATFDWTAGYAASAYRLWLGTTGVNSHDLYDSGVTTTNSVTPLNLPTNGETINARLYFEINGVWQHFDCTYKAWTQPALTAPGPGSTLSGSTVQFTWLGGTGVTGYQLWLGSTGVNSNNLYSSGVTAGTSVMAHSLPTSGNTIYARLYYQLNGAWYHIDYTFTAAP